MISDLPKHKTSKVSEDRHKTTFTTPESANVDAKGLEVALRQNVIGEVRFDNESKGLYSTDASNYRQIPIGVVLPKTEQDIINTVTICEKFGAPVISRGGGTSLGGQCCNVAVMMDMSKYYNRILNIDKDKKLVRIEPGIVLDKMRGTTEKEAGLTFGPDPATHNHCTLGGMLGNNSCGVHSVMSAIEGYGARTSDNLEKMTILTYDGIKMEVGPTSEDELNQIIEAGGRKGEIYKKLRDFRDKYADLIREKFPQIPRRVSGYNLPELLPENNFNVARALVGSESTCVTILEATMKLVTNPPYRTLLVLGYPSLPDAGYAVPDIMKHKPTGLEGMDDKLVEFMKRKGLNLTDIPLLPDASAWLLVEFGGDSQEEADKKAKKLMKDLKSAKPEPNVCLIDDPDQAEQIWEIRESGLGATAWVPGEPNGGPGWEDSAVDPKYVGDYLKDLRALLTQYDYHPSLYGHFGQGCIHCRIGFDFLTEEGIKKFKSFTVEAAHLVVKYGGSISGEHGDGQARGDLLEIMYGPELMQAFREFKTIWDPQWKMNPGKVIDTYGQLNNLRLGTTYDPPEVKTHFSFHNDDYNFNRATIRCVGVGKCRRNEGGTMCPSYMVTREEKHSTRGRARMLFEMMQGDVVKDGWSSEEVKDSLDLCLSCKGCKGDCPVNVDMATYKSEFLSHYYKKKMRPRSAYAFGWIYWWSRLASMAPEVANLLTQNKFTGRIAKAMAGVSQKRTIPKFAETTFRSWFRDRKKNSGEDRQKVILWADTFNNFFKPHTLVAGTEVLEAAGFEVMVPKQMLCCGRPLYDFGMLNMAKKLLRQIMHSLKDEIREGTPIVGLEPSCTAVFRDELTNLFPHDKDAERLKKQVFTLAEFLEKKAPDFSVPPIDKQAIVHGHCHQKALMKMLPDNEVLKKTGLEHTILDSGCCGMAGYFGYEAGDHYEVGLAAGERVLLPAVRKLKKESLIIADGFSCREQIEQETNRKGLHLAEVLQMALNHEGAKDEPYPERQFLEKHKVHSPRSFAIRMGAIFATVGVIAAASVVLLKSKRA